MVMAPNHSVRTRPETTGSLQRRAGKAQIGQEVLGFVWKGWKLVDQHLVPYYHRLYNPQQIKYLEDKWKNMKKLKFDPEFGEEHPNVLGPSRTNKLVHMFFFVFLLGKLHNGYNGFLYNVPPPQKKITLLRVIPTMTFQNSQVRFYVSLIRSGEGRHTTHLLKCVLLLSTSQTDWKQSSDVLSDISCDILSVISSGILSDISFDILFDISSAILSDICFDILSDISSDILSDISKTKHSIHIFTHKPLHKLYIYLTPRSKSNIHDNFVSVKWQFYSCIRLHQTAPPKSS